MKEYVIIIIIVNQLQSRINFCQSSHMHKEAGGIDPIGISYKG